MATLIIGFIVTDVLFLTARKLYKDKKSGKSPCGGDCSSCQCCCHGNVKNSCPSDGK